MGVRTEKGSVIRGRCVRGGLGTCHDTRITMTVLWALSTLSPFQIGEEFERK